MGSVTRTGLVNRGRGVHAGVFARYPELRALFLKHLARYGNLTAAAAHIRLSLTQVLDWRKDHPDFAADVETAMDHFRASIEGAIHTRAIDGWDEPKFTANGQIGTVRRYSDTLLIAYARRHIKEYREGDTVAGEVQHTHQHVVDVKNLTPQQRAALRVLLAEPEPEVVKQITVSPSTNGVHKNGHHSNGNGTA